MFQYRTVPVTAFAQNCSIVWCDETLDAAIIDPGGDLERLLAEVKRLCDRATILRDGQHVITAPMADLPIDVMIEHIVGKRSNTVQMLYLVVVIPIGGYRPVFHEFRNDDARVRK